MKGISNGFKLIIKSIRVIVISLIASFPVFSQTADQYFYEGTSKFLKDDCTGAILDFSKSLELNPQNAFAFSSRANCKSILGDYVGAISDWNKAIELLPNSMMYSGRGTAKLELKDDRGALNDLNKAIELDGSNGVFYYLRAFAKIHLGQKDSGCLDFSKAGELGMSEAYEMIKQYCQY